MSEMMEIRWHGRGGQGTVTAAKVLADACLSGGRYVQAFPEYAQGGALCYTIGK
jgi:pyruvate ferredoxin oxidoreductase gamma subunit